jgi:hypothetical protein
MMTTVYAFTKMALIEGGDGHELIENIASQNRGGPILIGKRA